MEETHTYDFNEKLVEFTKILSNKYIRILIQNIDKDILDDVIELLHDPDVEKFVNSNLFPKLIDIIVPTKMLENIIKAKQSKDVKNNKKLMYYDYEMTMNHMYIFLTENIELCRIIEKPKVRNILMKILKKKINDNCMGICKSGTKCKNKAKINGFCLRHHKIISKIQNRIFQPIV